MINKISGAWGYDPYDSDSAGDFVWEIETELLKKLEKESFKPGTNSFSKALVIFDILIHLKNNKISSIKKTQDLYLKIREKILKNAVEWANTWDKPSIAAHNLSEMIKKLDNGILSELAPKTGDPEDNALKALETLGDKRKEDKMPKAQEIISKVVSKLKTKE